MLPEAPTPEYRRGYLDAGSQILAALDESVIAGNNALPIGVDPLVAEDLVRMVAHGHPGWDLNPLPLAVADMAKTLVKIRETLQLERAADAITDVVTRPVSPVEGASREELAGAVDASAGGVPWIAALGSPVEETDDGPAASCPTLDEVQALIDHLTNEDAVGWVDEASLAHGVHKWLTQRAAAAVGQTVTAAERARIAYEAFYARGAGYHDWDRTTDFVRERWTVAAAAAAAPALPADLVERLAAAAPEGYTPVDALGWVLDERDAMRVDCPDGAGPATTPEDPIAQLEAQVATGEFTSWSVDGAPGSYQAWLHPSSGAVLRASGKTPAEAVATLLVTPAFPASPEPKGGEDRG